MTILVPARLAPSRTTLDNGVVVLVKTTRKTPAVTVNLAVQAGSACDPDDAPGLVHLLSRLIDRGTVRRSGAEIADEFDRRGVTLRTTVNRDVCSLSCTCLAEDFEPIVDVLADMLVSPSIPSEELELRRREVVTGILQDLDNPFVRAFDRLMELLYGPHHPYGRPLKGSVSSVESMTRDGLLAVHASAFAPTGMIAVIVGDVDEGKAAKTVARAIGGWQWPRSTRPVVVPSGRAATDRRQHVISMMNKSQADIAYGFTTIARADPAYHAYLLLNNVLGQYALGGRLGDRIREREGMAYYVGSAIDATVVEGPLSIRAGVAPTNVDRAIAAIDEELARLGADGVTAKELEDSKRFLIGSMPRTLETNVGIATFLQTAEQFGLGVDYDERAPSLIDAVTLDDVQAAATRTLDPRRASIVIAGPYQAS